MLSQTIHKRLRHVGRFLLMVMGFAGSKLTGQESGVYLVSETGTGVSQMQANRWPFEANNGQFQIHSTVSITLLEPFLTNLNSLPREMSQILTISVATTPVHVVVLESRDALESYVKRLLPNAPSRRALYYRHRGPGLVLTYFSPAWLTDARHECTHALLDASGVRLQQWLDEGLAEYFETATGKPLEHVSHLSAVQSQLRYGQVADLEQLEQMDSNTTMCAKDYRDAWSITAFLLNSSVESKSSFQAFLHDLQNERPAGALSHRLRPPNRIGRDDFAHFFAR